MGEEESKGGGAVVRWERFLPRMFLRVLLVEADDSTRQIIAALLRKCSYKVAAVSDGLKAWETLKEKGHFIDLVLTEVELPSVSGFCLLTMIMEHEACKNIPVIMMSSQDSVSMAFKCMLRGAADFLVKPIRRNELRNLWQHVWRRQASNSREGGQDENMPVPNMDAPMEENNVVSNQSSDNVRVQKSREQNDKVIDTQNECMTLKMPLVQSSCTKRNVEVESPTVHGMQEALDPNHSNNSQDSNQDVEMGEDDMDCAIITQMPVVLKNGRVAEKTSNDQHISESCNVQSVRYSEEAIDLIGALDNFQPQHSYAIRDQLCAGDGDDDNNSSEKVERSSSNSPLLELSLKRSLSNSCENGPTRREKPTLNHSNVSAFSRYDNKIVKPHVLLPDGPATEMREGSSSNYMSMSSPVTPNGSATSQFQIPAPVPMRGIGYDGFGSGYSAFLQPMFYGSPGVQVWTENSANHHEMINGHSSNQPNIEAYNITQKQYLNGQTVNRLQNQQLANDQVRIDSVITPIGANSLCNGTKDQLGSNGAVKACDVIGRNTAAATANAVDNGTNNNDGRFANGVVGGISYHKSSEREAALNKFRLKRKERCFEKKVRYQSRKKLAEQRPRVKGQFVRQVQSDP